MARTLALETSGREGSVAIADDDQIIAEQSFAYGLQNASKILPLIDDLCRAADWKPTDIERVAISIGPGSFTGLRIGVTLAKTLAFATGATIIPVQSVDVLAANAPPEANEIIIVLDAKRGQIFTARLQRDECGWSHVEPPHLDSLSSMIERAGRPVYLIGEGIPYHRGVIPPDDGVIVTDESRWTAHASVVATLADRATRQLTIPHCDPAALTPLYIRKPEAEEKANAAAASAAPK